VFLLCLIRGSKRLDLLHEAVPHAARIAVLVDSTTVSTRSGLEQAAQRLGVGDCELGEFRRGRPRRRPAGRQQRGRDQRPGHADADGAGARCDDRAAQSPSPAGHRPVAHWRRAGIFLDYAPNLAACYRQVVGLADKILKGAKPADLPVEQPTKFELLINMKTAGVLGLTVPQLLLARSHEVIE
jgi:putative tryptophan/tyrosine transport system substrate-binding protein